MFLSLWHYFNGYVIVKVSGPDTERFLNLATFHGADLWQVARYENTVQFCIRACEFKQTALDAKKAGCHIKIIQKKGIPFIKFKYRKRYLFAAGTGLFVILLFVLSSFVWLIDVEGTQRLSALEIVHTLEENGYKTGRLKTRMNLRQAENILLAKYPDLIWAGVDYEGTRMVVRVSESVLPPEMTPVENEPSALHSKRDALITYIAVEKGKPVVKAGDIVKKGDILVAGEMPLGEEDPSLYYTSSKAEVRGRTIYTTNQALSLDQIRKQYTGQTSRAYSLKFFNKEIPLYSQKKMNNNFDTQHTLCQLHITKLFPLPFGIKIDTQVAYHPDPYHLTEEEARDLLLSSMWQEIRTHLSSDAVILKREAHFKRSGRKISGSLYIIAEESIGYAVKQEPGILNEGEMLHE